MLVKYMTKTNSSRTKAASKYTESKTLIYYLMIIGGFIMFGIMIMTLIAGYMTASLVLALLGVFLLTAGFSCKWCADIKCGK